MSYSRQLPLFSLLKLKSIILSSLLLALTLFLFAPVSIYLVNINLIDFSLGDVSVYYLIFTMTAFFVLFSISALISVFLKFNYTSIIYLAIVFCLWVEGNLLNYNIGRLDGNPVDWNSLKWLYIPDFLLWISIIVIALFCRAKLIKNVNFIFLLLLLVQLFPITYDFLSSGDIKSFTSPGKYLDQEKVFDFSDQNNIVLIILDAFQSGVFQRVMETRPEFMHVFKDFTFYPNTSAGFPTTYASIPLILTGQFYDNSKPIKTFLDEIEQETLPSILKENHYLVESYSFIPYFVENWSNSGTRMPDTIRNEILYKQYQIVFIRYSPLILKKYFVENYYSGEAYFHKNLVDFYNSSDKLIKKNTPPKFKFIHLTGAHPPYQLDETLVFNKENSNLNVYDQAIASLKVMERFLEEMKTNGVYDNSLIIITADHGSYIENIDINETIDRPNTEIIKEKWSVPKMVVEQAMPLLLIKGYDHKSDILSTSNVPISIGDIAATIADYAEIDYEFPGQSIVKNSGAKRERIFRYYAWTHSNWTDDYLPPMYEYNINGFIDDLSSWKFNQIIYTQDGINKDTQFLDAVTGENLLVTIVSRYLDIFTEGFSPYSFSDPYKFWATGPASCIYTTTSFIENSFLLHIKGGPFLFGGNLDKQRMNIYIDQIYLGEFINEEEITIEIQSELAKKITTDGKIDVCFLFPDAKSPLELDINNDSRKLGYYFDLISFEYK